MTPVTLFRRYFALSALVLLGGAGSGCGGAAGRSGDVHSAAGGREETPRREGGTTSVQPGGDAAGGRSSASAGVPAWASKLRPPPPGATDAERLAFVEEVKEAFLARQRATSKPLPDDGGKKTSGVPADHQDALQRQLAAGWGWRSDRDDQVRVPLADWPNWRRIRLGNIDHLAAFKYTKDHHLVTSVFTVQTNGEPATSRRCLELFEERGFFELERRSVKIGAVRERTIGWERESVVVHDTEGTARFFFSRYDFSVAWVAYPAYRDGCLVYATVVLWDDEPELARRVLDRWVSEGLGRMQTRTAHVPERKKR